MRTLLLALTAFCAGSFANERKHVVVPADYFTLQTITEVAISPDGKLVAYSLGTWDKGEDNRRTDIWVAPIDGSTSPRRITSDRANDRHLCWGVDGESLYFVGNRRRGGETKPPYDGTSQVWKINLIPIKAGFNTDVEGRDLTAITKEVGGIASFDYAPLADTLFFSKEKTEADQDEFAKLRASNPKAEYGHGIRKVSEIHRLNLRTWRGESIIDDKRYIREFSVTKDGSKIAMLTAYDDSTVKSEAECRADVWEAGKIVTPPTEAYRAKAASPYAWLENLAWSEDGKHFAFCAVHDAFPTEVVVISQKEKSWASDYLPRKAKRIEIHGYGSPLKWNQNNLYFVTEQSGVTDIKIWSPDSPGQLGHGATVNGPGGVTDAFDIGGSPTQMVAVRSDAASFPVLVSNQKTGRKVIADHNTHTQEWLLPSVQHITWKAPDGTTVGGVLELPPNYKKGEKLPLVVGIHGGPTTSTKASLSFDPHNGRLYFATAGYAVLQPNYRGSVGYGEKFLTDLIGHENDIEVKDILAGIQHLIKDGIADPDRVACMGWSNGGYLTNCLITLKDSPVKFQAASSGAGILDTVAEWGFNDEPGYPTVFKKGLPWEQPDLYRKTSPTYGLGNVTTPTLIHVGGNDERCPPGQSRMLYRALKEYKQVPTELVVYTGEPHGLTKLSNRRLKMEWDLAWFAKYLKPPVPPTSR